jgi:PAS domain S-box-containing protein
VKLPIRVGIGHSVATRLLRVVFSLYLVVVVCVTAGQMIFEYLHQKDSIKTDLVNIERTFGQALAGEAWSLDEEAMRSTVAGMVELPTVVGVKIQNPDGRVIAAGGTVIEGSVAGNVDLFVAFSGGGPGGLTIRSGDEYKLEMFEHHFPLTYSPGDGARDLGEVAIYSNTSVIIRRVRLGFLLLVVTAIVQMAALWGICLWFSNHILRKPLTALAETARSVTLENLETVRVPVDEGRRDELRVLADSFNSMIRDLRGSIAEQRSTESALRGSEELYRTLVENIDLGIALIGPDHRILATNANMGTFFDDPSSGLVGKICHVELEQRDTICPRCPGLIAMETGEPAEQEMEGVRNDGMPFVARVQAYPLTDDQGGTTGFIKVVEDITERRRADEERLRLEDQVRHSQKLESLGVLAGGIAHDFNNLLVAILGNAELAAEEMGPDAPQGEYIREIRTASQRAAELTNQMLAYSGRGRFVIEPLSINAVVEEMGKLLAVTIPKKAVLQYDLDRRLPTVDADAAQLRQVVMNLVTNAAGAVGDASGTITIKTGVIEADREYLSEAYLDEDLPPGRNVTLEISDTGCGMDPQTKARLFDPFFTTKSSGRGLGMAAVLGIVRGHRGAIRVYTEVGSGSVFRILLPQSTTPIERRAAPSPPTPSSDLERSGTILVVDDEETVRTVAGRMLERAGYEVITAVDGRHAVEVFEKEHERIAAVLLDMTMPRLNGEETFRELRRIDGEVKVVFSSGFDEQDAAGRFSAENLTFIQKPYDLTGLLAVFRSILAPQA